MRNSMCLHVAAVFVFSLAAAMPAFATKTGAALAICISRGPDCTIANKGDNYEICVNNTDGQACVSCPNLAQPSNNQTCSISRSVRPSGKPYLGPAGTLADE
jgi:hypothetical protein